MEVSLAITLPEKIEFQIQNASEEWLQTRGMSRNELRKFAEYRVVRDLDNSPKVGDLAPDVVLEKLDGRGNRTSENLQLSSLFGQPLGLIFGSYT
jgi:hypothetical protein